MGTGGNISQRLRTIKTLSFAPQFPLEGIFNICYCILSTPYQHCAAHCLSNTCKVEWQHRTYFWHCFLGQAMGSFTARASKETHLVDNILRATQVRNGLKRCINRHVCVYARALLAGAALPLCKQTVLATCSSAIDRGLY